MEIYLVGGAVRDAQLGLPVGERDWVVVGSTPEDMTARGFRQVGRDFPVFLHPETQEEYALARTERKTGPGHTGFVCHAGPEVTLEEDLRRRDLTVNAMAETADGALIDPFGGARDLAHRRLRHVSEAFEEDPLRVFRVARFAAQLPGFEVAPETLALMRRMAAEDQLAELSAERVWQELHKALGCSAPSRFFQVLGAAGALSPWLAELEGVEPDFPAALDDPLRRFGSLGWQLTPESVDGLCARLRAPRRHQQLAGQIARYGRLLAAWRQADPVAVLQALTALGALASDRDAEPAFTVIEACAEVDLLALRELARRAGSITAAGFQRQGLVGKMLGEAIARARADLIGRVQESSA